MPEPGIPHLDEAGEEKEAKERHGQRLYLHPNRRQLHQDLFRACQIINTFNYNSININIWYNNNPGGAVLKNVLFLCVGNSCRSQMAEGFAREMGNGIIEVRSAGTRPASSVASLAIEVMREKGIDISGQHPKPLTKELVEWARLRISMGCGVEQSCPAIYLDIFEDWAIEDPFNGTIEDYRIARDKIEAKVRSLIAK